MNITEFYNYIIHPDLLNDLTLNELSEVIQRYPYFQAARMLYLKNLSLLNDDRYAATLTITSLYAPNRKALYQLIHNDQTLFENNFGKESTDIDESKIASFEKSEINNNQQANADKEKFEKTEAEKNIIGLPLTDNIILNDNSINESKIKEHEKLHIFDSVLENKNFDSNTMTFDEWLYHISKKNTQNESITNKNVDSNAIIDQFLDNSSQISRIKADPNAQNEDLTENLTPPEELDIISEPLAQLYYKQGYLDRALKIYEKLILKYPEKSIYFASLIQEIKNKLNKS